MKMNLVNHLQNIPVVIVDRNAEAAKVELHEAGSQNPIPVSMVIKRVEPFEDTSEIRKEAFLYEARCHIKSKLVGHRSNNPEVIIAMNCEDDILQLFLKSCNKKKWHYSPGNLKDLNHLLEKDWYYRIFNDLGDFSCMRKGTFTIHQFLPKPMKEYTYHGGAYMETFTDTKRMWQSYTVRDIFLRGG